MLEIKPIKIREFNYNIVKDPVYIVLPNQVRELEANYQKAIDALFSFTLNNAKLLESINVTLMDDQIAEHIHCIEIIEKAYKKSWSELNEDM